MNRKRQAVIDFQGTQIQALMEKLGKKRLLLSDDQRRRLAVKAKALGRKALLDITTIFPPDTGTEIKAEPPCESIWAPFLIDLSPRLGSSRLLPLRRRQARRGTGEMASVRCS